MAAASRPTPGAPIESAWGGQVHDVAVLLRGVLVNGAATGTAATPLPLDTILAGDPTFVDLASNELVAPVDGIYELLATVNGTGQAAGGAYFAHLYLSPSLTYQSMSGSAPSAGGSARRYFLGGLIVCAAGTRFIIQNANPGSGGSQNLERLSWRLVAQAYKT